ncbi:MAG: hypothetical protein IMZ61_14510 [Planctomycetes bacterium]|nr:hypothetical protein [Planctomycetota bacterium]
MTSASGARTPYQNLCGKLLLEMLNSHDVETLSQPAFKVTAKSLIRHYPEFNMNNEKPYKVCSLYREYFRFTKRGWDQYQKEPERVMYEHIWPIEAIFNELLGTKADANVVSIETIHEILKKTEVVILSDEESTLLNGSTNKTYMFNRQMRKGLGLRETGSAKERLAAIRAQIEPSTEGNSILVKSEP